MFLVKWDKVHYYVTYLVLVKHDYLIRTFLAKHFLVVLDSDMLH